MATSKTSFSEARQTFIKALVDYQIATRNMNLALQRISDRTASCYQSLQTMVNASGSMIKLQR